MRKILNIFSLILLFSCQNENSNTNVSATKDTISSKADTVRNNENTPSNQRILTQVPSNLIIIATGTEPGWILNIYSNKYEFIADYGKDTLSGERTFNIDEVPIYFTSSDLSFKIDKKNCIAISGETLDLSVEVKYKGEVLKGCGKILK
ncbi:MAG: hypothetical protein KatS3mg027_2182 [Bacteroidia bacterium]|nr:MAG: hypothetical protein KatS3mg027_2182 [Bacteroidia bacterium]